MKKYFKLIIFTFILCMILIPGTISKADSIAPGAVNGISFYGQEKSKFGFKWDFDYNMVLSSDSKGNFGYEVVFTTVKGKVIGKVDRNTIDNMYPTDISIDRVNYKTNFIVTNSKLSKQPFKIKVRAYTFNDIGERLYGPYSAEKIIVPRATIKSKKLTAKTSNNVIIKWNKIKGAKSYSVYVSKNKESGYKKKGTVTGNSFILKNNSRYQYYYVYVVANKVKCGKKKLNSSKATLKYSNMSSFYIYTKNGY